VTEQLYERTQGPVHLWFELSYSNYQVLPRVLMQSMPLEWQERMVTCLQEMREAFRHVEQAPGYKVEPVDWQYPEDLGTSQREARGIAYDEKTGEYFDDVGNVLQGCSVPVPAREPLPHYRRGYVEPREAS
jgi:hypothetical protein